MAIVVKLCHLQLLVFLTLKLLISTSAEQQVPCYFIFGDSLVDNGNNNILPTQAKVNYPPYGVDFPAGATGRFTNGRNFADILSLLLGFLGFIPPFVTARGQDILQGVNYGSGGSGIRSESGRNLGARFSLDQQLINHQITVAKIKVLQNNSTYTKEYLNKCLYTVVMGSNDYINNYYMPNNYNTMRRYTAEEYAVVLIQQYTQQLTTLYNMGARKVAVFGLGLVGCTPAEIKNFGADASGCVGTINAAVGQFDFRLKPMVDDLNSGLPGAKFIFVNTTNIVLNGPVFPGVVNAPCCVPSTTFGDGQCIPNTPPCMDRNAYAFFDDFHPTEIVNMGTVSRAYIAASPMDTYPTDISTLAQQ